MKGYNDIENIDVYNSNFDYLDDYDFPQEIDGIILQDNDIDSEKMNQSNKTTKDALNSLYERIRTLEDNKRYIEKYILKEIKEKSHRFDKLIQEIESINLHEDNFLYDKEDIIFTNDADLLMDKDGEYISPSFLKDEKLCLSYDNYYNSNIDNIVVQRLTERPYKSTNPNRLIDESYRSMYIIDEMKADGIYENIIFKLSTPEIVNTVNIDVNNCSVPRVTLVDINNNYREYDRNNFNDMINNKEIIKEVIVTINIRVPEQVRYDKDSINKDFFNSLSEGTARSKILKEYDLYSRDSLKLIDELAEKNKTVGIENFNTISGFPKKPKESYKYQYLFGVNKFFIGYSEKHETSFFLSKKIDVSNYKMVDLEIIDDIGDGTVEYFYQLENDKIYIPNSKGQNRNEYYYNDFNNKPKENTILINNKEGKIEDVKNKDIITYKTDDQTSLDVKNIDSIRVGAILRSGESKDPQVESIKILMYKEGKYE